MELTRSFITAALSLAIPTALAAHPDAVAMRAQVFYRSFNATSIAALDADALANANDHQLILTSPGQLQALAQALSGTCTPAPPEYARDLRLLIRWSGEYPWSWEASQFAYRDGRTGETCLFTRSHQDVVLATLGLER